MKNSLPELPSGFHSGEPVRADDFNKMLEWMRTVQQLIENGANIAAAGTTPGGLPTWRPRKRAPFEVDVEYNEAGNPEKIIVARGNVFAKMVHPFLDNTGIPSEKQMETNNAIARCEVDETELAYEPNAQIALLIRSTGWISPDIFARVAFEKDKTDGEVVFPLAQLREDAETGDVVVKQHHAGNVFFAWANWSVTSL